MQGVVWILVLAKEETSLVMMCCGYWLGWVKKGGVRKVLSHVLGCAHVDDAVGIVLWVVEVGEEWLQTSFETGSSHCSTSL